MRIVRTVRAAFALTLLGSTLLMAPRAFADEKNVCASSSEEAQRLIKQGKLLEARAQLLVCTRTVCPTVVKQDCDGWLSTLDATIPSLVIAARDEAGHDLLDLAVTLDGAAVDSLNGRAVPVDPGVHKLRIEAVGKLPSEQQIVVHEGERARPVTVTLTAKDHTAASGATGGAAASTHPADKPTSPLVYVLGTLTGVSIASFATFEIKAATESSHLRSTCAPRCNPSDVDRISTDTVIANVSLAAGIAFAGSAFAVWYFGRGKGPSTAPSLAIETSPSRIGLRGTF